MTTTRSYVRPLSTWWWLKRSTYLLFVLRELSSLFIAWYVVYLLLFLRAVGQGEPAYEDFLDVAAHPAMMVLNGVGLAFVLLHTVTWFNLTPQAMVVRLGGRRVPASAIIASQYVGLAVVSAFVFWLVTR
jgi:fumarate reductase subunit C